MNWLFQCGKWWHECLGSELLQKFGFTRCRIHVLPILNPIMEWPIVMLSYTWLDLIRSWCWNKQLYKYLNVSLQSVLPHKVSLPLVVVSSAYFNLFKNYLEIGASSEKELAAVRIEPTTSHARDKHSPMLLWAAVVAQWYGTRLQSNTPEAAGSITAGC